MRVKLCGMNNWRDVKAAVDLGADAVGFLVGITHLAEDKVSNEVAAELIRRLPPMVSKVAVTHLEHSRDIIPMLEYLRVDTVQLHSDISVEEMRAVRKALPWLKVIRLVSVTGEGAVAEAERLEGEADALLLDSRTVDRLGGTGQTHDWRISRRIVERSRIPVILAGGLNPDNLRSAIETVRPFAVDVNSGVEIDGEKAPDKMRRFIEIAHSIPAPLREA